MKDLLANFGVCDRCKETVTGSHYHCGGCDAIDVTGMYGHHSSIHMVDGKAVNTGKLHHCHNGDCELER